MHEKARMRNDVTIITRLFLAVLPKKKDYKTSLFLRNPIPVPTSILLLLAIIVVIAATVDAVVG